MYTTWHVIFTEIENAGAQQQTSGIGSTLLRILKIAAKIILPAIVIGSVLGTTAAVASATAAGTLIAVLNAMQETLPLTDVE